MSKVYIVSGPSGCGKGTVLKALKEKMDFVYSVSATTRAPREGETNGVEYHFISKDTFKEWIGRDEFLEHAEYAGNFYGTPITPIKENIAKGKDVIVEIEVQGFLQVKERMPEAVTIFIMPPSLEELERRLRGRGTDSEEKVLKRLEIARREIEFADKYDYVVVNDEVERASDELLTIMSK